MHGSNPTSLWAKVCLLDGEPLQQVKSVYDPRFFPIEFRHYFATLIESEQWNEINPDNPLHYPEAKGDFSFAPFSIVTNVVSHAGAVDKCD